ncbi:MAG: hypothetical protein WCJ59_00320 [bacterium]
MAMNGLTSSWGKLDDVFDVKAVTCKIDLVTDFPKTIDIWDGYCPRCGKGHLGLEVKMLSCNKKAKNCVGEPIVFRPLFPAYCVCPESGEPIILMTVLFEHNCVPKTVEDLAKLDSRDRGKIMN